MNKFHIIDNFLEVDQYKYLHDLMTNDAFPWFYHPEINYHHTDKKDLTCYFTHTFYNGYQPNSNFYDDVKVFVNKLEMKTIIRITNDYNSQLSYDERNEDIYYIVNEEIDCFCEVKNDRLANIVEEQKNYFSHKDEYKNKTIVKMIL